MKWQLFICIVIDIYVKWISHRNLAHQIVNFSVTKWLRFFERSVLHINLIEPLRIEIFVRSLLVAKRLTAQLLQTYVGNLSLRLPLLSNYITYQNIKTLILNELSKVAFLSVRLTIVISQYSVPSYVLIIVFMEWLTTLFTC